MHYPDINKNSHARHYQPASLGNCEDKNRITMKKEHLKYLLFAFIALLCNVTTYAHDFELDGIFYNLDASVGFDGTFQQFVCLKTYDKFILAVDVSCLVGGDCGNSYIIE